MRSLLPINNMKKKYCFILIIGYLIFFYSSIAGNPSKLITIRKDDIFESSNLNYLNYKFSILRNEKLYLIKNSKNDFFVIATNGEVLDVLDYDTIIEDKSHSRINNFKFYSENSIYISLSTKISNIYFHEIKNYNQNWFLNNSFKYSNTSSYCGIKVDDEQNLYTPEFIYNKHHNIVTKFNSKYENIFKNPNNDLIYIEKIFYTNNYVIYYFSNQFKKFIELKINFKGDLVRYSIINNDLSEFLIIIKNKNKYEVLVYDSYGFKIYSKIFDLEFFQTNQNSNFANFSFNNSRNIYFCISFKNKLEIWKMEMEY